MIPIMFLVVLAPVILIIKIMDGVVKGDSFFRGFIRYIKPIPPGLVWGTDLKRNVFPWITALIIVSNVIIFFNAGEDLINACIFLPYGDPGPFHIFISIFSSAFLHGSPSHLIGNMFFLWTFGSTVEPRVGADKFVALYFLSIFLSTLIGCIFLVALSVYGPSFESLRSYHSLGASGAISGVMGLFVVRCYFAKVTVGIPVLFLPFISMKMKFKREKGVKSTLDPCLISIEYEEVPSLM